MLTDLTTVRRPIDEAGGLPNAHYTDPNVFAEETRAALTSTWAGLAVAGQVPEPGDAIPMDFAGAPLLLLRDRSGTVRVFQNVCSHRGMILVSEPRKIEGALRCPYHSWCYGLDGKLVSTPHVGGPGTNIHPAINRGEMGLNEVRSHIWRDVVFINLDGGAPAFETVNANLMERWSAFEQPMFHGGADSYMTLDVKTNWKLAVENFCESYHLPWVHPGLNSYSRLEDHYHIERRGEYAGQGTKVYRRISLDDGTVFPDFAGLPEFWNEGAEYIAVFPNTLLGSQRDHCFAIILDPLGISSTREHIHLYYASDDVDPELRRRNSDQWMGVFKEDIGVCEGMQKGRRAPAFDGGRFSPAMDGPTHLFHDWVAGRMENHRASKATQGVPG